jgi:hypothetical protein
MSGHIIALHRNAAHEFSKHPETGLQLHQGLGIEGDAHMGATVRHRSRVAVDPIQLDTKSRKFFYTISIE